MFKSSDEKITTLKCVDIFKYIVYSLKNNDEIWKTVTICCKMEIKYG